MFRRKKKQQVVDYTDKEEMFEAVYNIVKKLPKGDFNRFIDGIKMMHDGHEIALRVKTREEREDAEINSTKSGLEFEEVEQ